ncbi:hypothetical protein [Paraburkholderia sediminicola]|uniref:hypothetical protein n=1 Tax=Paraburkholderia sediminicola TaxID=458836 RepID=UPI0038B8996A
MKLRYPIIAVLLAVSAYGGTRYEATRIQQTCEADRGATVLNGTPYLCLSQRQIDMMRAQPAGRGA